MIILRQLCWWLPKCRKCGSRDPLFADQCFNCSVAESKAQMWRGIADAAVQLAPLFVEAFTHRTTRSVRRFVRRNPRLRLKAAHSDELKELRKMAGLPESSPVEPAKPTDAADSGEAK